MKIKFSIMIAAVLFLFGQLHLLSDEIKLFKYEYGDFRTIYYGKTYSYLIEHVNKSFKNAFDLHKSIWNYSLDKKIVVFVNDFTDFGNGGASALPFNFVTMGVNPFDNVYEIMPANERIQWLASHELTHVVMTDKAAGNDNFFRTIFQGKPLNDNTNPLSMIYSYLAVPRWYSPRWFHEGIAIAFETFYTGGFGRMLGGYDEMKFRAMVIDSSYFYFPIGLETEGTTADFQVGANAYLYGTRFVTYLIYKYGLEKLLIFYNREPGSSGFFATQFEKIYEKDLTDVWQDWIDFEKEFQNKNISTIRKNHNINYRKLLDKPLGSASRQFYNQKKNSVIVAVNQIGDLPHIEEYGLTNLDSRRICEVLTPRLYFVTNMAYNPQKELLFVTENNQNYRDFNVIDYKTGKLLKSNKFARFGEIVSNPVDNSVWGLRNYNGRSILAKIQEPFEQFDEIYTFPFGTTFFDLDISPDGKLLSGTYATPDGRQKIVIYNISDLINGKFEYREIYEFEDNSASNFVFSMDGKLLFGTSYITGVSNIFRIDIDTKDVKILTNAETGFFRPIQISQDSLLAYYFESDGFLPVILPIDTNLNVEPIEFLGMKAIENNPKIKEMKLPPLISVNIDTSKVKETEYNTLWEIGLSSLYPIVEGYKDFPSYGFKFNFYDDIFINSLIINLGYSPNIQLPEKERYHFNMKWNYWEWELNASYNRTDFYDLFGPTKRSRAGYNIAIQYHDYFIINRKPESFDYRMKVSFWGDLKTLPSYQNVDFNAEKLLSSLININYSSFRKSLGSIEEEQGESFKLFVTNDYVDNYSFTKIFAEASFGKLLPLRNSSFWLRIYAGKSFGDDNNPFNYFYFGGFGNNYLDMYSVSRYREAESLPGRKINEFAGNSYIKGLLEWTLPPIRFRKFGFLPFYFTYSRLSLFAGGLGLNNNDIDNIYKAATIGAQLDFEMSFFYLMKTHLSFGYAVSFADKVMPDDEFMISLKF